MTRISLNVVVYNEEARLEACLRDARPWVDEIVVVDQSSTDSTPDIAARLADVGITDVHHGFCEASRELAARYSSGDWLLVLDADEILTARFKENMRGFTEQGRDGYVLFREFYVDDLFQGLGKGDYRFFKRNCVCFLNELHTEPQPTTANIGRPDYPCIIHRKTMEEQLADELRYESIILSSDMSPELKAAKLSLNVRLNRMRKANR